MLDLGTLQLGVKVDDGQAKGQLQQLGGEVEKTGSKTEALASKAKTMIKAFVAAYAIKELAKLGKAALDSYAQFEQLEGGVRNDTGVHIYVTIYIKTISHHRQLDASLVKTAPQLFT